MKNWKTTLAGLGAAVFYAFTGQQVSNWKHVLGAVLIAAIGFFAKDAESSQFANAESSQSAK